MTSYDLFIANGTYYLSGGGSLLLSGGVRDYSSAAGFGTDVYRSTNFVFLGDDITSAGGITNLSFVSIETP